jgi:hypothetical protein
LETAEASKETLYRTEIIAHVTPNLRHDC